MRCVLRDCARGDAFYFCACDDFWHTQVYQRLETFVDASLVDDNGVSTLTRARLLWRQRCVLVRSALAFVSILMRVCAWAVGEVFFDTHMHTRVHGHTDTHTRAHTRTRTHTISFSLSLSLSLFVSLSLSIAHSLSLTLAL